MKRLQIIVFFIILLAVVGCCRPPTLPPLHKTACGWKQLSVPSISLTRCLSRFRLKASVRQSEIQRAIWETSYAVSDARITPDGALFHSLANKPQKKPVPTEKEVVYRDSLVYRDKIVEKAVPVERELTWWQQTQMRGFWIVLAIIVVVYRKKIFAVVRRFI